MRLLRREESGVSTLVTTSVTTLVLSITTNINGLIEESLAARRAAETRDTVIAIPFSLELVVVRQLLIYTARQQPIINREKKRLRIEQLTSLNVPKGINDDTLTSVDLDDFRRAVGCAAMIDEARNTTMLRSVDDGILINAKQVTASNAGLEIPSFTHISHLLPNLLANIFDNHVVGSDVFLSIQTPNCGWPSGRNGRASCVS